MWRIYYVDGSTFDNSQGDVTEAPSWGVAVAVYRRNDGVVLRPWGRDHYWYRDDEREFYGGDIVGLLDALAIAAHHVTWWGAGRTVSSPLFREVLSRAIADPDFQSDTREKIDDPANFVSVPG